MKAKDEVIETLPRDEAMEEMFNSLTDHVMNNYKDIILDGFKWKGLNNMSRIQLEREYNSHFGTDIKIV
ncbi:MAG: hypothetical protein KJI69_05300 [Patescibacteria group bacterium]|nr:hypothetical protein [Patescibacteria group bacterium]